MNELNVNNDLLTSDLLTTSVDQLIFGQLTTDTDIDIYKFQTALLPTASGVGFTAKFSLNETFDAQAGWKISLIDNNEQVLSSIDSSAVTGFPASGELSLSGSYDSAKIAYIKVEKSDADIGSSAQYKLIFEQHQQMSEDVLGTDAVSLMGDVANHGNFALVGSTDTDTFLFETTATAESSTLNFVFIDPNATASISLTNAENSALNNADATPAAITNTNYSHDSLITFVNASETINLSLSFAIVDSDSVSVTLKYADGSIAKDGDDADILARKLDYAESLSVLHSSTSTTSINFSVGNTSALSPSLTVRTLEGGNVVDSDGNPVSAVSVSHGKSVSLLADASATAYKLELASTTAGDYSVQVDGLAARVNGPALLTVDDLVGSDYYINADFSESAEADLPVYLVNKTAGVDLASVFIPTSASNNLDKMYFMSNDSVVGVGAFDSATIISAADYTGLASSQHLDLSSYATDTTFSIWGFAANSSLIAADLVGGNARSVGQHNASAIMGATFKVTEQGINSSLSTTTIAEGETATLTLSLSQALTGTDQISVSLSNTSNDLSFDSDQITFDSSNQSIDVIITAISGDADFSESEAVTIDFTPTTDGYTNLLVPSLNLTTTEDIPSFSISTQHVALVSDSSHYQYTISLDNASSFSADYPANVSIAVASGFIVSTSADVADVVTSAIAMSANNTSVSLFVLADTSAVVDADIPIIGLESAITHTVALGSLTIANAIDSITVTRAVIDANSTVGLSGTITAESVTATTVQETMTLLAGDDSVIYISNSDIHGDSLDGGDGTDLLSLVSAKTDYVIADNGNQTYTVTHGSHVLNISNIENVKFADADAIALDSLNEDPIVNDSHGLTDSDFKTVIDTTETIDLSSLFSDPESDSLTLYFSIDGGAAPSWVQFDADTKVLTLSPTSSDSGTYTLAISASDEAVPLDPAPSVSFSVVIPTTATSAYIIADDTHGLTGTSIEFWDAAGTSASKTVSVDNGAILLDEDVSFNAVKLTNAAAYTTDPINLFDVLATVGHIVGTELLTGAAIQAADVTNDDSVNLFDVLAIVQHIVADTDNIDHFDLVDSAGARQTTLSASVETVPQYSLVMNGDADLSGGVEAAFISVDIL
jgi:hypothetical protein